MKFIKIENHHYAKEIFTINAEKIIAMYRISSEGKLCTYVILEDDISFSVRETPDEIKKLIEGE